MNWDALFAEFRAAGGTAENVRVGEGSRGRGIFAIDPARPVSFHLPQALTVPLSAVELRAGELVARRDAVEPVAAELFDLFQKHAGWSAGGYEASLAMQRAWHELPEEVMRAIAGLGVLQGQRFLPPSEQTAFDEYAQARTFGENGNKFFIHFIDLVNHSSSARGFARERGVGVEGTFADEVLVRYNVMDAIESVLTFGFADRSLFGNCISLTVDLPNGMKLTIERSLSSRRQLGSLEIPALQERAGQLYISHLPLGNLGAPDLPRAILRKLLEPYVSHAQSDQVFEGLAHFNRVRFLEFLRLLRKHNGAMISMLEDAAINQLEALSASVGARTLA